MKAISRRRFFKISVGIFLLSLGVILGACLVFSKILLEVKAPHLFF